MKSKIDKSRLMKRAWEFCRRHYKGDRKMFGYSLRCAWKEAKRRAAVGADSTNKVEVRTAETPSASWIAGATAYYSNSPRGTYFGD